MRALILSGPFGRRRLTDQQETIIGSSRACDLHVEHGEVSGRHARIFTRDGDWYVDDMHSTNGTALDGRRVTEPVEIRQGGVLRLGGCAVTLTLDGDVSDQVTEPVVRLRRRAAPGSDTIRIGTAPDNDVVVDDSAVQLHHAVVIRRPGGAVIRSLDPQARLTVRGEDVAEAQVDWAETFYLGTTPVSIPRPDPEPPRSLGEPLLVATGAQVSVKPRRKPTKQLLAPLDLVVREGEFVAIIGGIGAGKSTLLRTLGGVIVPTQGDVRLNGQPVAEQPRLVGFVPQSDVVHLPLTAWEALSFAARLRMPPESTPEDVRVATEDMLHRVGVANHAKTQVRNLSGGERKSVVVGTELFGDPPVLLLDEPGASLDPFHETALMARLRGLATGNTAVVVVTHVTRNLDLCDRILVMGPGGTLLKDGSPDEIRAHFQQQELDRIYEQLDGMALNAERGSRRLSIPRAKLPATSAQSRKRDYSVTVRRSFALLARERATTLGPVGLALLAGALIGVQFHGKAMLRGPGSAIDSAQLIFLMAIIASLLALFSTSTPLFYERNVTLRDVSRGMAPSAFIRGRLLVLSALCAIQALAVVLGALLIVGSERSFKEHAVIALFTCIGAACASAMGAWIAWLSTTDRLAAILSVIAIVPQLIFAGVLIPAQDQLVKHLIATKWVVAAAGSYMELDDTPPNPGIIEFYGNGYFDTWLIASFVALVALGAAFAALAAWQLRRVAERKLP